MRQNWKPTAGIESLHCSKGITSVPHLVLSYVCKIACHGYTFPFNVLQVIDAVSSYGFSTSGVVVRNAVRPDNIVVSPPGTCSKAYGQENGAVTKKCLAGNVSMEGIEIGVVVYISRVSLERKPLPYYEICPYSGGPLRCLTVLQGVFNRRHVARSAGQIERELTVGKNLWKCNEEIRAPSHWLLDYTGQNVLDQWSNHVFYLIFSGRTSQRKCSHRSQPRRVWSSTDRLLLRHSGLFQSLHFFRILINCYWPEIFLYWIFEYTNEEQDMMQRRLNSRKGNAHGEVAVHTLQCHARAFSRTFSSICVLDRYTLACIDK